MRVLVTGSSGLIGSEAVEHYDGLGHEVHGIDNNMRREFFGPMGDTGWNLDRLRATTKRFTHHSVDIRDAGALERVFTAHRFDAIIHCAAQPSHDKAKDIPLVDFGVNATGTVHVLEMHRRHCPEAPLCHMSTNKVYGDAPNELPLRELETRWEYADAKDWNGVREDMRIDRCLHSLFGASKTAGDLMAQEYGRYFNLPVGVFRGGCLTGPRHSGVELHGFLSYLAKVTVTGGKYTIFGYKGKQVRDQIHSLDVIRAFDSFIRRPRSGEVYNLGGGRENSASLLECIRMCEEASGKRLAYTYTDQNRVGDHICYISDLSKMRSHFPDWDITIPLREIVAQIVAGEMARAAAVR
jgi:CDP-paratose 2-epimerase